MMNLTSASLKVFLALDPCDMRKSFNGLSSLASDKLQADPARDVLFVFIADKYQDHLPHYRQSQRFRRRHQIDIGRQTLNTWTHATARHLSSIGKAIRAELLRQRRSRDEQRPHLHPPGQLPR